MPRFLATLLLLPLLAPPPARETSDVRATYTKHEYEIPMRDGKKLFTAVYVPKDASRTYPILLTRTPYSVRPYGVDRYREDLGPSSLFRKDGFIFAYQDVRGRFMSEGEWREMTPQVAGKRSPRDVDESTDAWDTIDWLVRNVRSNGLVGVWGISYPGFYAAASLVDSHPALKAVSPQAPVADLYMGDDSYHNGVFLLAANFDFYTSFFPREGGPQPAEDPKPFDYGTPDGYDYFLKAGPLATFAGRMERDNPLYRDNLEHTTYDAFWKSRALPPRLRGVRPAVLTVGGWYDAEDPVGPLSVYRAIEKTSPGIFNALVMGPWCHGCWLEGDGDHLGNLAFATKTSAFYRESVEFPFFAHYLKGAPLPTLPEALVFQTGTNEWRRFDAWPPASAEKRTLYFSAGGRLSFDAPAEAGEAFDEYLSDPSRPVPFLASPAHAMPRDYMTEDQRFAATRPDVLVYETEPLAADLGVAGPIGVTLHVSTSGTDSDFVVKLVDAYPGTYPDPPRPEGGARVVRMGGYQQLVRGEPFRGKFRRSFEKPEPFEPGKPETIAFSMPDVCHTFRKGHRVMVHVQSSWFPLVDRNPQTFVDIPTAAPADFREARERIHRSRDRASSLTLLVEGGAP